VGDTPTAASVLRDVVLALADAEWAGTISAEVTASVTGELPEIAADDALQAAVLASNTASLQLFVAMVQGGLPPGDAEPPAESIALAHELVRRGVGIDVLLRGYHASEAAFFTHFVERVHSDPRFSMTASTAIEEGARWLFAFVGALTREIAERYAEERERWIRSTAAARLRDVRAVLSGEATDAAVFSARLRYPLHRTHLAVVLWTDAGVAVDREPAQAMLERTAVELAGALGATSTLVVGLEDDVVAAWMAGVRPAAAEQIQEIALGRQRAQGAQGAQRAQRVHGACGLPGAGIGGFRKSHGQAMHARRVARLADSPSGMIVSYDEVALTAIATADLEQAREFAQRELGGMRDSSDEARRLAATVRIYLEEGASARRAAARLHVHENTIKNRIRTAEELLGHPVTTRVAELLLALRIVMLDGAPGPGLSRDSSAA
jgi:hypothetical protein